MTPDGVRIAYRVVGDGPIDLAFCSPNDPALDVQWDDPPRQRFFLQLASLSRLILSNQRGTGISDPAPRRQFVVEELVTDCVAFSTPPGPSGGTRRFGSRRDDAVILRRNVPGNAVKS
jgi:pimeloyl-ACP methyl ester carboxylesterase